MGKNWSYYTVFKRGLAQMKELGPGLLMERYWHRKRILKAKPVECPEDADLEVHVQVCHRDWLNGIWTIMSFAYFHKLADARDALRRKRLVDFHEIGLIC